MAAGDRQVMKAMEEVTTNNVRAAIAHGNVTRKMVRELEDQVKSLDGLVRQQQEEIQRLRKQMVPLLTAKYQGGTSDN